MSAEKVAGKAFLSRPWFWLAGAALLGGIGIAYVVSAGSNAEALSTQVTTVSTLSDEIASLKAERMELAEDVLSEGIGAQVGRITEDESVITDMMRKALTWSNHDEYLDARKAMVEIYGLSPDSQFMQTYLPEAPGRFDSDGKFHSYINAKGLNSEFDSIDARLVSARGVDYEYIVTVRSSARSVDGTTTSSNSSLIRVTVTSDGSVKDLTGFAVKGKPRTS